MRKLNLISGAFGIAAIGLTACSNEMPVMDENLTAEADETRFISIQISAPSDAGTRAFENGSSNESYIDRLDFFFYDALGNPTSTPVMMDINDIKKEVEDGNAFFPDANTSGNNVTRVFTSVVPANLTQGQNLPSQVICIVNGQGDNMTELKTKTLDQLVEYERDYVRTGNFFRMSNSVYYGQNILTGQANQRLCATPINVNTQLFGTRDEALDAVKNSQDDDVNNDGALVDIYVERLAAKVGLQMGANVVQDYTLTNSTGGTVTLTFVPQYWAMNATDKTVYLTKRYGVENADGINQTPNYTDINNALTNGSTNPWWNDPTNFRSYWGTSPSYFDNEYPDVSDDINDLNGYTHDYSVRYRTYNEVVAQANRSDADAGIGGIGKQALEIGENGFTLGTGNATLGETPVTTSTGYIYAFETTASRYRINDVANNNPAAVVASAVVVGKYSVNGNPVAANSAFYIDRNAGTNGTYYATADLVKAQLASRQRIVFSSRTGSSADRLTATDTRFVIKHPDLAVRNLAGTKLAGRLVTLQLSNDLAGDPIYYYHLNEDGTGNYEQVTTENLNEVNAQLLAVGYMDMFNEGLGFYSVPIRHLRWNDALYNATTGYDWAAMPSGALGVVRNHVYNLTINSISGLATALRSPDQPIVPAKEEANQYIAARLNVLAWNVVNSWSVNL